MERRVISKEYSIDKRTAASDDRLSGERSRAGTRVGPKNPDAGRKGGGLDHRQAAPLIVDWVRGRLDGASAREVETHAGGCTMCQEAAEAAAHLDAESRRLENSATPHVSSDALARYVETPHDEPIATLARIGSHVRTCPTCQEDVTLMRAAVAPSWSRSVGAWFGGLSWSFRPLRLAFPILAILLAYPAWLGLVEYPRYRASRTPGMSVSGGGTATLVLRGGTRGGDDRPAVRLRKDQLLQPVFLDTSLPAGSVYIRLIDETGRDVWRAAGDRDTFWDEANRLVGALIPTEVLDVGDFRLELRTMRDGSPVFTGGFRVLPGPQE